MTTIYAPLLQAKASFCAFSLRAGAVLASELLERVPRHDPLLREDAAIRRIDRWLPRGCRRRLRIAVHAAWDDDSHCRTPETLREKEGFCFFGQQRSCFFNKGEASTQAYMHSSFVSLNIHNHISESRRAKILLRMLLRLLLVYRLLVARSPDSSDVNSKIDYYAPPLRACLLLLQANYDLNLHFSILTLPNC